ncbi:MAG: Spo0B domain-containing protein [Clostridia bacterium]|nr:Spo0B domain-containing protein [Clostridia bacterium]
MKLSKRHNTFFSSNGVLLYTIAVFAFGIVLLAGLFYVFFIRKQIGFELQITLIFAILIEIIAIMLLLALIRFRAVMRSMEDRNRLLKDSNEKTSELNTKLRAQRHDFLNHLQVIHGLLELNQFEDACKYMEKTYEEIQSVTNVLKTSSPAVNAILQVKQNTCQDRDIQFKVLVSSKLENVKIDIWDLCAILSNLIDNAINAVEKSSVKRIVIFIKEDIYSHIIKVKDSGSGIPVDIQDKIFNIGFTTKRDEGHGMGLYISRQTIMETGGDLSFETSEIGTIFTIKIPKKTV